MDLFYLFNSSSNLLMQGIVWKTQVAFEVYYDTSSELTRFSMSSKRKKKQVKYYYEFSPSALM